jgi:two-component system KDP operon response regulator KdpE
MARHVAIFDDSALFLRMMRLALESDGYEVLTAGVTRDIISVIHAHPPDLVIFDMGLRRQLITLSVLHDLRANAALAGLPVIVCTTGQELIDGERQFLEETGAAVLMKPFEINDLLRLVGGMLRAGPDATADARGAE